LTVSYAHKLEYEPLIDSWNCKIA